MASAFQASAFQNNAFQIDGGTPTPPVTTAGRSFGTQYREKTISRELRERERAARKAARKVETEVVAALQDEAWFHNPESAKAALAHLRTEIEAFVPQFIEEGTGRRLRDAAVEYLIRQAIINAEQDEDFLLLTN